MKKTQCADCNPEEWAHKHNGQTIPLCDMHWGMRAGNKQPSGEGWREETIKFYNATPAYRTAEEWCSFIASLISRSEARAREDREKMTFIIQSIKSYSPDGEIGTLCDTALSEVLSAPRE